MIRFHEQTLKLLDIDPTRRERSITGQSDWAAKRRIALPAAFVEWAQLDDGSLLRKYSNDESFWFDEPELTTTPEGIQGLRYNSENQNNFDRIITLDQGDDPPVLFAWLGEPPWVTYAERFSEAVFAQVFDWQYLLEFRSEDPAYKEITYYEEMHLESSRCLATLRARYEELTTTRFIADGERYSEYRFMKSPKERMTALVDDAGCVDIRITGVADLIRPLKKELLKVLG